ncbi:MAG: chromosome segregation ATPase [Bradymonadia bacterium]|jgi:chromosome segregation ATPase
MTRQARLAYTLPDGSEHEHMLDQGASTTIGRHPQCTITVTQPSVSRRHVRIWHETGSFLVEDLGSSNGTYINGQKVTRATLTEGCELRCGDFALQYGSVSKAPPVSPPTSAPSGRPRVVGSLRPRRLDGAGPLRPTSNRMPTEDELRSTSPKPVLRNAGRLQPEPTADPSTAVAPPPVVDSGELDALQAELESQQAQVADHEGELRDRDRRIRDLEESVRRAEEQLGTQTDKALDLRDQATQLQSQLEDVRTERSELVVEVNATKDRLDGLHDSQQAASGREQELAEQVNDLKREVMHREKANKEIERELELASYDLKSTREDNENLRLALGDDDSIRKKLNTRLAHLEQILEEKESMIEILQRNEERMEDKLTQARADARLEGGQRSARLREQLTKAEEERDALTAQVSAVEGELATLKEKAVSTASGRARDLQEQINKLKRENRDLRRAIEDAKTEATDGQSAEVEATLTAAREALDAAKVEATRLAKEKLRLEAALDQAQDERRDAESAAASAQSASASAPAGGGDFAGLRDAAVKTYETLNDLASELRNNVRVGGDYVKELRALVEIAARTPEDADAIRAVAEDIEALLTIESAVETLGAAQTAARDFKKAMRTFREILRTYGYGS